MIPDKVKAHFERNKTRYVIASYFGVVIIVYAVTRRVGLSTVSNRYFGFKKIVMKNVVSGENNTLNNVSYIFSNRQGPPSWVVRCIQTNEVFMSQRAAALAKGIDESTLSRHLLGLVDHVDGLNFERICLAA